jgi:hypothetical protein
MLSTMDKKLPKKSGVKSDSTRIYLFNRKQNEQYFST